jgi:transcription elongation factor Elf1
MLANFDETFLHELDSSDLDSLLQSSIQTHFNMKNPNDWILAYSLIKTSTVQIPRINNKELLYLTNNNPQTRGPKSSRFTCPICGSITVSMERLQRHVNQHGQKLHLKIFKPEKKFASLICEKCKATFSSSYALRKHQRVHTRG